jgi:hypothetical protein
MSIDIKRILKELESLPEYNDQISLQTVKGSNDPSYGTGRLKTLNHTEEDFNQALFDIPYTNSVIELLGMTRTRVMRLKHKTCYSYHQDPTMRMHIPLITNENCFFVIDDKVSYYPADGSFYLVDTTKKHTFVNASFEDRIHLVGCVSDI